MATIMDVAKEAGVSRTTVSRVLNNSPRVDQATRKNVLNVIRKLNYQPSNVARNFRKKETKLIAVLIPRVSNPFYGNLLYGMEEVAIKKGYNIILCNTGGDPAREMRYLRMLEQKQVDGLIMAGLNNSPDVVKAYLQYGPIVIACGYTDDDSIPAVVIDDTKAARMAVEHLVSLGHQRIAFINGPEHITLCRDRKKGYIQALEENGLTVFEEWIQHSDFTIEGGYQCTNNLLQLKDRPSAIFAANDDMAVGVIQALQEYGVHVPKEMAVVGFDNNPMATVVSPKLTTIDQPIFLIGLKSMEKLIGCLENGDMVDHQRIILDTKLCIRESSVL
ncbi:LacI family DNA-binding transcriptional regulator [Ammoniphilus sp. 3BR4]|uniref:LacI family DNA-binding transcriptional regulator n=1 Tax=Ammoniphilus sp. 3BR4 TaxID=3158265 RepID=UPI0034676701